MTKHRVDQTDSAGADVPVLQYLRAARRLAAGRAGHVSEVWRFPRLRQRGAAAMDGTSRLRAYVRIERGRRA